MCTNPQKIYVNGEECTVACGKCPTCKRKKSQEWAIKLINEAKYHKKASFITLTFDNKILLDKNSIAVKKYGANPSFVFNIDYSKEYFQKFIKRLRKKFKDKQISYFHVAEYGEKTKRPHHHAIIFGENFENDRKEMQLSKTGHIQYYSETLQSLWAVGSCSIQDCNENNIIYITQYSLKKFKNNEHNKKYKAKITFSNRQKINCKFARRNPSCIEKGYIETNDKKRFKVPKSYIDNLKKEKKYEKYIERYENCINEYISKYTNSELLKKAKIKEEILMRRDNMFNKSRDL